MRENSLEESPSAVAENDPALTPAQFHILLTLADGSRHGYRIMQEIRERTQGALELGPGTLYRSIKQLLERGLISEMEAPTPDTSKPDDRRRPYNLTLAGKIRLREEANRLRALVRWAEDAMVLDGSR
jgi:DNA-binding PadR family transcriptional regulator